MNNPDTFHKAIYKTSLLPLLYSPSSITKLVIAVSMASFLLFLVFHFLSLPASSIGSHRTRRILPPSMVSIPAEIQQACKATRFPDLCQSSLSQSPRLGRGADPLKIVMEAIAVSSDNLQMGQKMVKEILDSSEGNPNRTTAAKNCLEALGNSAYRTQSTGDAVPSGKTKDARAWFGAALLFQYDCWSGLKYANDTAKVNETMAFLNTLTMHTSNALSMLVSYDLFGKDTASWRSPLTERDGFWEPATDDVSAFRGVLPSTLHSDVTVCKDGGSSGCYATVQEAVNAAPNNGSGRFVIHIKEGVYEEIVRLRLEKKNVVFVGDGIGKTVISGSLSVGQGGGISTSNTATVGVLGDGFMATALTIQNTAGADGHQAVAFRSDSDLSILENCEFLGNQDTLYAKSLRQYYKSCRIEGNVDFIFGNSASFFDDCQILIRPRQLNPEKGETNAVTAHGRTDPAQSTGFVFQNCLINGTEEYMALYQSNPKVHKNFLGRPWKEYSRTVFIHCNLETLISPQGWMPWSEDFALKTLYYGEFENSGEGSELSGRVSWSSRIPEEHVAAYSARSFIQGDGWIVPPANDSVKSGSRSGLPTDTESELIG